MALTLVLYYCLLAGTALVRCLGSIYPPSNYFEVSCDVHSESHKPQALPRLL